ncbi:MAG TPA: alpha-(1-_3)-arabinofuranosyltransferase family protein, partial [Acidimicrobiia bacterium]
MYVPILRMQPGKIEADTKSYLYLDPGRFLKRAASLWDPSVAMGTLSHQTIGYLFPMGPYYWLMSEIGVPAWVSQRLWLATMILAAGYGMRYLLRTLGVDGPGIGVAMVAFAFTPYVLGYTSIYSALLLPWAALPWWLGYSERALHRDAWKYAALFAITVQIVGSVNGSSLAFALIGPLLWVLHAAVFRRTTWPRVWAITWRTGLLTFLTSLWWFIPLLIEGKYGVNILRFTESTQAVAATSQPYEILRGLGNWYFYGTDRLGAWVDARPYYTQRVGFVFISYLVPALALVAAAFVRWRHRAYFVVLTFVAMVIAVGAAPYNHPSLLGGVYKNLALHRNVVFAFRNVGRVMPLLSVSIAAILGVAVSSFFRRMRALDHAFIGVTAAGLVFAVCIVNAYPALAGAYYTKALEYSKIPTYWRQAIAKMDSEPHSTRVLALPGSDFASYRWGDTREPIEPGLMSRPYVARELVAWGTAPTVNLLRSLDERVQESSLDPRALAPMARLMGVGDVEIRSDLEGDKYSLVGP